MSEFLNSIKITDEDKKKSITKILFTVIHSSKIMSLNEVLQSLSKKEKNSDKDEEGKQPIEQKLNQNEILATYSLAKEIKISTITSSNQKLMKYLELTLASVNEENLLKFVNETVKDIEITKKRIPNAQWRLQVGKIFKRLEEKNLCNEEDVKQWSNDSNKSSKIIKPSDYLEK